MRRTTAIVATVAVALSGCGGGSGGGATASPSVIHASPGPCGSARFSVHRVFPSTAAAGTQYTRFVITNLSGRACRISGYPRIFALGADGRPVGGPAPTSTFLPHTGRKGPRTVTIARHGTASFIAESSDAPLRWFKDCHPRAVAGDRIVLPGSRRAETMTSPVRKVCSGGAGLAVGPIE